MVLTNGGLCLKSERGINNMSEEKECAYCWAGSDYESSDEHDQDYLADVNEYNTVELEGVILEGYEL